MLADVKKFMNHELDNMNLDLIRLGWGPGVQEKDEKLLNSMCDYFIKRIENEPLALEESEWHPIMQIQSDIIDALKSRNIDYLHENLKNIFSSTITHGTTQGKAHTLSLMNLDERTLKLEHGLYVYDKLLDIMESVGLITTYSPEQYVWVKTYDQLLIDPSLHLEQLMNYYGLDLTPPKYQGMLFGIDTKFGVYSIKDMHAIGLALMVYKKFGDRKDVSICEIGGGAGQFAYYMNKIGFNNYSIVDLPTISVSQMYFLNTNSIDNVKFLSHNEFDGKYDVVINVDSMPEMAETSAREYIQKISANARYFLSINQERRDFTVHDLCKDYRMFQLSRNPFWFRKGYVIEEFMQS